MCRECGLVASDTLVDLGPEWSAFTQDEDKKRSRAGAPISWAYYDKGLSTAIGWQDRDAMGRRLGPEARARLYRLRKWHRRSKISEGAQRNLAHALSEMSRISYELNLPRNVVETSGMVYRRAIQRQLIRGRTIQSVAVASVYMACRQCGVIRILEDVAKSANITKREAARNYRFLLRELKPTIPQVDPRGFISKIVNKLALGGETERLALLILSQASEMKLTGGRGPHGMAAVCVYISSQLTGERRTQGEIAGEAQVTEVTVRNRYKELVERLEFHIWL